MRTQRTLKSQATLPGWLQHGIYRAERERKAMVIARPMRNLMDLLAKGEVLEMDGRLVMSMPEVDEQFATQAEYCEIAPAIEGWRDCWQRIAPDISTYHLGVLAARLREGKPITPRLVEQARAEFDATVARIVDTPPGVISSAIRTTQIALELEKITTPEARP